MSILKFRHASQSPPLTHQKSKGLISRLGTKLRPSTTESAAAANAPTAFHNPFSSHSHSGPDTHDPNSNPNVAVKRKPTRIRILHAPPLDNAFTPEARAAALRARGLIPQKPLSKLEEDENRRLAILKPREGAGGTGEGGDSEARKMAEMWRARNSLSGSEGAGSGGGADDQGKEPSLSVSFLSGS